MAHFPCYRAGLLAAPLPFLRPPSRCLAAGCAPWRLSSSSSFWVCRADSVPAPAAVIARRFVALLPTSPSYLHCSQVNTSSTLSTCPTATPTSSSSSSSSPVNVEEFTLNEEVVKRDMEYLARWNELAEKIQNARIAREHEKLLAEVQAGLQLLEDVGAENAPIQCEALLCLEGAQACIQLKKLTQALTMVSRAKESLIPRNNSNPTCSLASSTSTAPTSTSADRGQPKDGVTFCDCELLHAHILILQQKGKEAEEIARKVLAWVENEGKGGGGGNGSSANVSPIQAVGALHLKRTAMTMVGRGLVCQAQTLIEKGNDEELNSRTFCGKALDILIDALNLHIDEKDHESVKITLESIYFCFEGLQDWSQAATTCRKYISWCHNKKDEEGEKYGEELLSSLRRRYPEHDKEFASN